ncbi:MAG: hypothetical protein ABI132_05155 [Rhodanobacteraceae bacterium]
MSKSRILLLLFAPLLLLTMAFRQVPLVDQPPIAVPAGFNDAQVENVIAQALMLRGWTIDSRKAGEIDATYAPRDFSVSIAVHYDTRQIRINYVTSNNLKYEVKNGQRMIHTNYASWIKNLVNDIHNQFMMAK